MKRISTVIRAVAVISVISGLAIAGCAKKPEGPQEPYKIGAIFASTGPASMLGLPEKNTVEMLAETINAEGGIKIRVQEKGSWVDRGVPVEVIMYDTEADSTKTVTVTNKLIESDKVDVIIGPTTSGTSLAIVDIVTKAEVPLISCAASVKIVKPVSERYWVFKTPQTDTMAVEKIYETLKTKGLTKIAILTVSDGFGDSGRVELQRLAADYGLNIVSEERYGGKDTDMSAQLTKIKGTDAQAIICWGTNPGPAIIAKNRKQLGITIPLYNSHGVASPKFIELAGDAAEGTFLPAGKLIILDQLPASDPQREVLSQYKTAYESRFGAGTINTFGGHAYDAFKIALLAIGNAAKEGKLEAGKVDRATIRNEIEKIQGFYGTGGIFNYSPEDHNGLTKDGFVMVEISNGGWKLAE
ncbi:MAG: ABC transporter substrate-binding protein [bacterium]|nr:ABC transporter substrate-binding protein [bacterium]MDT8366589.1 ABC transporter substrate-binding protein [bacterium]